MTIRRRISEAPPQIGVNSTPLLVDEKQASKILGVSLSFLRKGRSEGSVRNRTPAPKFVSVGGRCYYRVSDLENWVASLESREVI